MSQLQGLSRVLLNLNKSIEDIRKDSIAGLTEAALVVKADSVKMTPIDLGNLRGSAYIIVTDKSPDNTNPSFTGDESGQLGASHERSLSEGKQIVKRGGKVSPIAIVGYTANYAFWVHEMPSHYNFNSGTNQYLMKAFTKNQNRIKQILVKWTKI